MCYLNFRSPHTVSSRFHNTKALLEGTFKQFIYSSGNYNSIHFTCIFIHLTLGKLTYPWVGNNPIETQGTVICIPTANWKAPIFWTTIQYSRVVFIKANIRDSNIITSFWETTHYQILTTRTTNRTRNNVLLSGAIHSTFSRLSNNYRSLHSLL